MYFNAANYFNVLLQHINEGYKTHLTLGPFLIASGFEFKCKCMPQILAVYGRRVHKILKSPLSSNLPPPPPHTHTE